MVLTLDNWIESDRRNIRVKKKYIDGALNGDTGIINGVTEVNKENIFYMLMFCLCVPQSKAIKAEQAIERLRRKHFYTNPITLNEIIKELTGLVRFHPTKAARLFEARSLFLETDFWKNIKRSYELYCDNKKDCEHILQDTRQYLIQSVNGIGMKLSSHFMRNIGMPGLAILDVHIIDGLKKRGITDIEKLSSSRSEYLNIEEKMRNYANAVGISLEELDLLLWSQKTGYVFK